MVVQFIFSSILQIWYVEVWISWGISETPLDFEITRVDCNVIHAICRCVFSIRAVWSGYSLSLDTREYIAKSIATLCSRRLIWVVTVHIYPVFWRYTSIHSHDGEPSLKVNHALSLICNKYLMHDHYEFYSNTRLSPSPQLSFIIFSVVRWFADECLRGLNTSLNMELPFHCDTEWCTRQHYREMSGIYYFIPGIVGDWKNHFTVAQNESFDSLIEKEMQGSIFKFEYSI